MRPDFLITPYEVKACPDLRPSDGDVYAVVYWLERLAQGKCVASNAFIADVLGIKERTVRTALERMEHAGFIQRIFQDPERKLRKEIRTLVRFSRVEPETPTEPGKELAQREPTPGEIAKAFFDPEDNSGRDAVLEEVMHANPDADRTAVKAEMKKFISYWTEPNKSGTKVRWQMEKTFDVRRRLATWFGRAGKYDAPRKRSGSGVTV